MKNKSLLLLTIIILMFPNVKAQNTGHIFKGTLEISDSTHTKLKKQIKNAVMFKDSINITIGYIREWHDSYIGYPYFDAETIRNSEYFIIKLPEQDYKFLNDTLNHIRVHGSDSVGYINLKEKRIEYAIKFGKNSIATYSGTLIEY